MTTEKITVETVAEFQAETARIIADNELFVSRWLFRLAIIFPLYVAFQTVCAFAIFAN